MLSEADNYPDVVTCWRLKLEDAKEKYLAACAHYHTLLIELAPAKGADALRQARTSEEQALTEYRQALTIFADLTLCGKLPPKTVVADGPLISVVDNDISMRDSLESCLRSFGYRVRSFESALSFLDSDVLPLTDCLLLDVQMPGMNGLELQTRLRAGGSQVPVIFITANDSARHRRRAAEAGAFDFFLKPFNSSELVATVRAALESCRRSDQALKNIPLENGYSLA